MALGESVNTEKGAPETATALVENAARLGVRPSVVLANIGVLDSVEDLTGVDS